MNELDKKVAELAEKYRPLAAEILREVIRIPADHVDRPVDAGGDPSCGLSNHEKPRLDYLKRKIVECGAVRRPEDVGFDGYGNLVWTVEDPDDGISSKDKSVVYFDGHTDTVNAPEIRVEGEDRRRRLLRRTLRRRGRSPRLSQERAGSPAARVRMGAPRFRARRGRPALGRRHAGHRDEDSPRARAAGRAQGRDRALVRDRRRGGQRRRRPAVPREEGPPGRRTGARARRRDPHGGDGGLRQGCARDLPRPAGPHADRGHRHREVLPWLDAVGRPEPAGVGGAHRLGGREALRGARRLPRPPVPRPRHAHGLVGASRHAERLRRPRAVRLSLRPPPHDRRDAGEGRGRRRRASGGGGRARGGADGRDHGADV
jgi:hypothetical protein